MTSKLTYFNISQDCTSLTAVSQSKFKLYDFNSLQPYFEYDIDDYIIVESWNSSSLLALVSRQHPRNLTLLHFKQNQEICTRTYPNFILSVKFNQQRIVVCLPDSIYIEDGTNLTSLHTIQLLPHYNGLCALAPDVVDNKCFIAFPSNDHPGNVHVFDAMNMVDVVNLHAHKSSLKAIALSPNQKMVATASEKGTVVRVISIEEGTKLFEFRRGLSRTVEISTLLFSLDSSVLCCSSNTETIHLFQIPSIEKSDEPQGWMSYFTDKIKDTADYMLSPKSVIVTENSQSGWSYLSDAIKSTVTYIPARAYEVLQQQRAFAWARLPKSGLKTVCALVSIRKIVHLVAVCEDGMAYTFNYDPLVGGECSMAEQFQLFEEASTEEVATEDK